MTHISIFLFLAFAVSAIVGCRKEKKFPERIQGIWEFSECNGSFPPGCNGYHEVYDESNWFVVLNSSGCLIVQEKECSPKVDSICRDYSITQGFDPVSALLPYRIDGDLLIRTRHKSLFDRSTDLITDTLRIVRIRKCLINDGGVMTLDFQNGSQAKSYGLPEGTKYVLKRIAYSKSGNACGTPCG